MRKIFLLIPMLGWLLVSCNVQERNELRAKVDSLSVELETVQEAAYTLQEVGVMIDSIDANRKLLRSNMVEGTPYEDYLARMNDINEYVKSSQAKLRELEETLQKSNSTSAAYASTIRKLKREIEKTSHELVELQAMVDQYKNENNNLAQTVALQDSSLVEKTNKIQFQQEQLVDLETRVDELLLQSTQDEADAYYAKAQVFEEMAKRTKFAPRKKRETTEEALELYRLAFSMGKTEAADKISALEKKI